MPELPEVQTVVDTIAPTVVGRPIRRCRRSAFDILTPAGFDFPNAVLGRTIASISRRAKRIVFRLDDGNSFFIHLGMSGRLTIEPNSNPVAKHTHAVFEFAGEPFELRFVDPRRFGGIFWLGDSGVHDSVGPEPLTIGVRTLHRRLLRTNRAIKSALLDQKLIAGLGNIYVDESLFAARIHPTRVASELSIDEVRRLSAAIKRTLRRAIAAGGSSLRDYVDGAGRRGTFQNAHRVFGRSGEPCRTCRTTIEKFTLGGRSTHACPACQPPQEPPVTRN